MNVPRAISNLLRSVGRPVHLVKNNVSYSFLAYCNPIRNSSAAVNRVENGALSSQKFLVICSALEDGNLLDVNDVFLCDGENYFVESASTMFFGSDPAYRWAVAVKAQEVLYD